MAILSMFIERCGLAILSLPLPFFSLLFFFSRDAKGGHPLPIAYLDRQRVAILLLIRPFSCLLSFLPRPSPAFERGEGCLSSAFF